MHEQEIGPDRAKPYRVKVFHLFVTLLFLHFVNIAVFLVIYPTSPPVYHVQLVWTLRSQAQPLHPRPRLCPLAHFKPIYSWLVDAPFWSFLAPMGIGIDKRRPLRTVTRVRRPSRRERRFRRRRRFPKRRRSKFTIALEEQVCKRGAKKCPYIPQTRVSSQDPRQGSRVLEPSTP